jgi:glycosyltransferase involved in cell wall biosynthesis
MRVSVVICTLNRADALGATLECLRHQHHDDFEVIVVNGPSTDHTLEVLAPWREHIRYRDNSERNLSVSRNIGIRASTGELIAFIDDDALPEPEWLTQAIPAFDDPEVAGAGGIVFDHTGMNLQYRYSASDRLCRPVTSEQDFSAHCFPGTFQFPYLQGTNQIYRRDRLLEIGGFDECIFFYGDDADICARLIDHGWVIRQLATSPVHHKFLPSGIRDHQRITTNWFPVVHDHTYFCLRHASPYLSEDEILHHIHEFIDSRIEDTRMHEQAGRLAPGASIHTEATSMRGFAEGLAAGLERIGLALPRYETEDLEFQRFPTAGKASRLKLCIVSSSYTGNVTGGIGRYISELAPAMAQRGHDVRVVTRATGPAAVDFEDGVWVHRIDAPPLPPGKGVAPDVLAPINSFATAAVNEVCRIRDWTEPDLVFAPLWDLEALGVLRETDLPVAVNVSTPVAIIGPMAGFLRNDGTDAPELRRLLDLESEIMDTADIFQVNTAAAIETIRAEYGKTCRADRWHPVHLGLKDRADASPDREDHPHCGRTVYFAGRFEARKGIDTLLAAMEPILRDYADVELVLAGEDRPLEPGELPFGALWRSRHQNQEWMNRVTMLGVVDDALLHERYAEADVVVLPSRYESFGLVMAEAMMHGRPLVSTDTSGVREVVRNGIDGVLVDPGSVDELECAIRAVLDDPTFAARLGATARERFEAHLSIERAAERFEDFCQLMESVGVPVLPATLTCGDDLTLDVRRWSAATVIVRALEIAVLVINQSDQQVVRLREGERRRVRLGDGVGDVTIRVEQGSALVERLVAVASAGAEA